MNYGIVDEDELLDKTIISSLNDMQQQATLFAVHEILQIKAPPGSGKTKIIIARLLFLLICCKVPASEIVVTTFGKKASVEIKERLNNGLSEINLDKDLKNEILLELKVGTFHSLCLGMLKQFGYLIGLTRVAILSEDEHDKILKKSIKRVPDHIYDYYKYKQNKVNLMSPAKEQKKRKNANKSLKQNTSDDISPEETMLASLEIDDKHWTFDIKLIKKHISKLKSQGLTSETYIKTGGNHLDQALLYFYQFYESECKQLMKLDFDDLLLKTYLLLKENKNIIPVFKHIMVDEFQDTSFLQLQIVLLWSSKPNTGITVVGDPNQCIYAFRDASPSNFTDMVKLCNSQVQIVPLNQNYRSSQKIIDCCQYILNPSHASEEEPLCGQFDCEYGPVYKSFKTFGAEAQYIVNEITYLKKLPNNAVRFNDIAILTRTKRQMYAIEKKLLNYRIPYKIIDNNGFLQRKEVVQFMNLLKLVTYFDSQDKLKLLDKKAWLLESLSFMENVGLGKTSISNLSRFIDVNSGKDPIDIIANAPQLEQIVSYAKGRKYLLGFLNLFLKSSSQFLEKLDGSKEGFTFFLEYIYKKSGLKDMFTIEEEEDDQNQNQKTAASGNNEDKNKYDPRHFSIDTLKNLILNFRVKNSDNDNPFFDRNFLDEFISSIDLYVVEGEEIVNNEKVENDVVTICTIHKSKGLEWPVVFVPGCSEDYIPCIFIEDKEGETGDEDDLDKSNVSFEKYKTNNISYQEKLNEERRIFYVALSRAKQLLYMTSIERDGNESSLKLRALVRSRFINDDLVKKLNKYPYLLSSLKTIKQFYKSFNIEFKEEEEENFSIFQLIRDYNTYQRKGCNEFIWMNNEVFNINTINLEKNKQDVTSAFSGTNFMSAKDHIALGLSNKRTDNNNVGKTKAKRKVVVKSKPTADITTMFSKKSVLSTTTASILEPLPQSQHAPQNDELILRSPLRDAKTAPILSTQIESSPKKEQQFAPTKKDEILKSPQRKAQLAPLSPTKDKSKVKRSRLLVKEEKPYGTHIAKKAKLERKEELNQETPNLLKSNKLKKVFSSMTNFTLDDMFNARQLKKIKVEANTEDQDVIILSD